MAALSLTSALALQGCGGGGNGTKGGGSGGSGAGVTLTIPRIYPPVRASTPSALIADPTYMAEVATTMAALSSGGSVQRRNGALGEAAAVGLATIVQERFYTMGPTEILRIVSAVDARTSVLDTRASEHPCLTSPPVSLTYTMAGGETFGVKLQCLQRLGGPGAAPGGGWLAFGFGTQLEWDAGVPEVDGSAKGDGASMEPMEAPEVPDGGALGTEGGGRHFYLVEGQSGGMGSAYHFDRETGNVEAWIAVADSRAPANSQVIMHMVTDRSRASVELALAGSGVGFCAAHLKAAGDHLYVEGKTNAPPPPGTPMTPGTQYCASQRTGCFATTALSVDLGGDAAACAGIARASFAIAADLDASSDPGATVTPSTIYTTFSAEPAGIAAY